MDQCLQFFFHIFHFSIARATILYNENYANKKILRYLYGCYQIEYNGGYGTSANSIKIIDVSSACLSNSCGSRTEWKLDLWSCSCEDVV